MRHTPSSARSRLAGVVIALIATALTATALAATPLLASTPAAAAAPVPRPPGTVVVADGPGAVPEQVELGAATPQGVVYVQDGRLVLNPGDPAAAITLSAPFHGPVVGAGSFVLAQDSSVGQLWFDTADGTSGTPDTRWDGVAPGGGLVLVAVAGGTRLERHDARTGAVTTLAELPVVRDQDGFARVEVRGGPDGALVWAAATGSAPAYAAYVPYAAPRAPAVVDLSAARPTVSGGLDCAAPTATHVACATGGTAFTAPVGGGPVTVVARGVFTAVRLAAGAVGWVVDLAAGGSVLATAPVDGGPVTRSRQPLVGVLPDLISDGSWFYLLPAGGPAARVPGVHATPDAASALRLVAALPSDYEVTSTFLDAGGRLFSVDNSTVPGVVALRLLTPTADGVRVGPARRAPVRGTTGVQASGARIGAYPGGGAPYTVTSPVLPDRTAAAASRFQLSGNRLYVAAFGGPFVLDLVTGKTGPTSPWGDSSPDTTALWGDHLVFVRSDNAVVRRNLATGQETVVSARPGGRIVGVETWGDLVAIGVRGAAGASVLVVDTATGASRSVALPEYAPLTGASAAGFVVDGRTLYRWDVPGAVTVPGTGLMAAGDVMAWHGSSLILAAPVPWPVADAPRSLGNPLAPASVARGNTWTFDLPASASLTTCTVEIRRAGSPVGTLACDPAYTRGGDAIVAWDITDGTGAPVPAGRYTWTVVAANADGPLQRPDGTPGAVTGTLTVTR